MKDRGVVNKVPIQWRRNTSVFEAVLLKHTRSISSAMRKYFLIIIAYITKRKIIHPKKFKKLLVN
jgi:hypothetical protein